MTDHAELSVEAELNHYSDGSGPRHTVRVSKGGRDPDAAIEIENGVHSIWASIEQWNAIKTSVDAAVAFLYPTPTSDKGDDKNG